MHKDTPAILSVFAGRIADSGIDPQKIILKQLELDDISDQYLSWLNDSQINKYLEIRHKVPLKRKDVIEYVSTCNNKHRYHWGIIYDKKHIGNRNFYRIKRIIHVSCIT